MHAPYTNTRVKLTRNYRFLKMPNWRSSTSQIPTGSSSASTETMASYHRTTSRSMSLGLENRRHPHLRLLHHYPPDQCHSQRHPRARMSHPHLHRILPPLLPVSWLAERLLNPQYPLHSPHETSLPSRSPKILTTNPFGLRHCQPGPDQQPQCHRHMMIQYPRLKLQLPSRLSGRPGASTCTILTKWFR